MIIRQLPKWCLVSKFPAFYDFESLTATEQTARLYGKVSELIESYNKYVEEINKAIGDYENEKDNDIKSLIHRLSCLADNYINTLDIKIMHQDRQIAEVYEKFSEDIINSIKLVISDLKSSGELDNAILTALDNINGKVDNFIAEMTAEQEQLKSDYESTKSQLDSDYQTVKSKLQTDYNIKKQDLETDYQSVKSQLDSDYQTAETNLQTDYNNTKSQLDIDYQTAETNLQTDYNNTKSQLETYYQTAKSNLTTQQSEFEESISGELATATNMIGAKFYKTLFSNTSNPIPFGRNLEDVDSDDDLINIPNILDYRIVMVQCCSSLTASTPYNVICYVDKFTRSASYVDITGVGTGVLSSEENVIHVPVNLQGYVYENEFYVGNNLTTELVYSNSTNKTNTVNNLYITKIIGLI